jgi:hypothetical protein
MIVGAQKYWVCPRLLILLLAGRLTQLKQKRDIDGIQFLIIAGLVMLLPWVLYLIYLLICSEVNLEFTGQLGDSFGVLTSLFSGLAMVGVVLTVFLQQKTSEHERLDRTIELLQHLRDEKMATARNKAWSARKKWFTDSEYRRRQIDHLFPVSLEAAEQSQDEADESAAIFDMLGFYSMLARHPGSNEDLREFGFYYQWWQGFLRSFVDEYNKKYDGLNLTDEEKAHFPKGVWLEDIDRLDQRLGLPKYEQSKHLLDRVFL